LTQQLEYLRRTWLLFHVSLAIAAYRGRSAIEPDDLSDAARALSALPTRTPPPAHEVDIEALVG
jgi:hypothetical protein